MASFPLGQYPVRGSTRRGHYHYLQFRFHRRSLLCQTVSLVRLFRIVKTMTRPNPVLNQSRPRRRPSPSRSHCRQLLFLIFHPHLQKLSHLQLSPAAF